MKFLPLMLVLASGCLHAVWNLLLKRSDDKTVFIWWMMLVSVVFFSPMLISRGFDSLPAGAVPYAVASGLVQVLYIVAIGKAYGDSDLSVVYPLSRGSAPVFIFVLASLLLKEKVHTLGITGIFSVAIGVYVIFLRSVRVSDLLEPMKSIRGWEAQFALLIGLSIAIYHVIDKKGVSLADPVPYVFVIFVAHLAGLTAWTFLIRPTEVIKRELKKCLWSASISGAFSIFGYFLVVVALSMDKASYVGSVRNIGIVFSVLFARWFLGESYSGVRLMASVFIFAGVLMISLA
jgi:drug/metabolite transporter (DMT)-like permease